MARKSQTADVETPEPEQTSLAIFEVQNPVAVLTDSAKFEAFYERIKAETDAHVPDVSTEKGRNEIKSLAFRVVKTKTAIDAEGKRLTEEWRANVTKVDASRKVIRDRLDALRDKVRAPLTEWEVAEVRRIAFVETQIQKLRVAAIVEFDETAADVEARIERLQTEVFPEDIFQGHREIAANLCSQTLATLLGAYDRLEREEAERAELLQLRAEQEARVEREAAELATKESLANIRLGLLEFCLYLRCRREDIEAAETKRQADIAAAAKAAEDAARAEVEAAATAARIATERAHAEALAAEKRRADEAERFLADEAKKAADIKAAQEAEQKRLADEQAARDKDRAHRSKVMAAAKEAIMLVGVSEATAKSIVRAIVAEEIPAVTLRF